VTLEPQGPSMPVVLPTLYLFLTPFCFCTLLRPPLKKNAQVSAQAELVPSPTPTSCSSSRFHGGLPI